MSRSFTKAEQLARKFLAADDMNTKAQALSEVQNLSKDDQLSFVELTEKDFVLDKLPKIAKDFKSFANDAREQKLDTDQEKKNAFDTNLPRLMRAQLIITFSQFARSLKGRGASHPFYKAMQREQSQTFHYPKHGNEILFSAVSTAARRGESQGRRWTPTYPKNAK